MTPAFPPRACPVCNDDLLVTRLTCPSCATELSGTFTSCEFCALTEDDRAALRVFLASRGNMRELERHLGVSYPTARARFDTLLGKLGIARDHTDPAPIDVLESLARGDIDVDQALDSL